MPSPYSPALISASAPPRNNGTQEATQFQALQMRGTFAWGVAPGQATLTYPGDASTQGLTVGSFLEIQLAMHYFAGLCQSDVLNKETDGGFIRTLEFSDLREFLKWDYVFCAFNKPDHRLVNGVRVKRYKHMYPADWYGWTWTYTNTPLLAYQILAALFSAPSVGSPWAWDLTGLGEFPGGVLNMPLYDFDCLQAKRLDSALSELSERTGTVFSLISTPAQPYRLVWTRKGAAPASITFPSNSDNQRVGQAISGNATNVGVFGDRNQYQVMDVEMVPDWARAWERFLVFELFADDIYNRDADPITGIAFNATPGDPEQFIGRQLATARALTITLREYVDLTGDNSYADYRKFAGRYRMDMPAALYLQILVYRAFRPNFDFIANYAGLDVPITSLDILDQLLCRVSHDPSTGDMTFYPAEPVDSNGYAICKGYQVGQDLFRTIKPEQFSLDFFSETSRPWQAATFQIDDSGEGIRFIIFDTPVVVSENLLVDVDGNKVLNANFSLEIPAVKAALVFEAEKFTWWLGTYPNVSRDHVENVQGLNFEAVLQNGAVTEILYTDGQTSEQKATDVANFILVRQFFYTEGGFDWKWDGKTDISQFGTQLASLIDRVQPIISPTDGVKEIVDFCNERKRDNFEPERDYERRNMQNSFFPGQQALRMQAETARKIAAGFRQMPFIPKLLSSLLNGTLGGNQPMQVVWFVGAPAATMAMGTPIRKTPTTSTAGKQSTSTVATCPSSVTQSDTVFVGVTVRHNEDQTKPFNVQSTGEALARVMGPVNENDGIGLAAPGSDNTYLVKGGSPSVGRARQKIASAVIQTIKVDLGSGGGSSGGPVWLP